jgi:hypothetical protein
MEEARIARLLTDGGVTAIAAACVYPGSRPQGTALPAVALARVSGASARMIKRRSAYLPGGVHVERTINDISAEDAGASAKPSLTINRRWRSGRLSRTEPLCCFRRAASRR